MPSIKQMSKVLGPLKSSRVINWFPGHMYSGMQAMIGKLNTVDCIIEVHDARIPFTGRNKEFRQHLGLIKQHILVLNKIDLADLSRLSSIEKRLKSQGDNNVFLTDLRGNEFSFVNRGYTKLMNKVVELVNNSDRHNRQNADHFKIMFVGIPNVGKSTLINRLRQYHVGIKGTPAKTGPEAGVTRHVANTIRICNRPPIYSLDTPGILQPGSTKGNESMRLALCAAINDVALNPEDLADYLLKFLNESENFMYMHHYELERPAECLEELVEASLKRFNMTQRVLASDSRQFKTAPDISRVCWRFIREFRKGIFGKVMFD